MFYVSTLYLCQLSHTNYYDIQLLTNHEFFPIKIWPMRALLKNDDFFPIVFPVVSCFLSQKLSVFQVHEDIDGNRCIESHNFITTCVLHYKDEINFAHIL